MKKLCLVAGIVGIMGVSMVQAAVQVRMEWGDAHYGHAGEFKAFVPGMDPFETFCLEAYENINIPGIYDATFATYAVQGGPDPNNFDAGSDPISKATAWLYSRFLWNPTEIGYGNTAEDAGLLQAALWWLENESFLRGPYVKAGQQSPIIAGLAGESSDNKFLQKALDYFKPLGSTDYTYANLDELRQVDAADREFGVWVMNLTRTVNGELVYKQSVLAPVPEPSTIIAGALLLLPFAASTIRRMRKNR